MKTAFQGVHGAYSEVAAKRILGPGCQTHPFDSFDDVFKAVATGKVHRGVIPIENSLAGSIHQNYDLLLSHPVHIVGEIHLRIEHVLMVHPSSSLRRIDAVRSHPQALAQCSRFFLKNRQLRPIPYFDTAGAAKSIGEEHLLNAGAIAGEYAARLYKLKVVRRHLENQRNNFTRFLVISRTPWRTPEGTPVKTSIAFAPAKNEVGILFRILGAFSLRGIDLLKIESRPDPHSPFEYLFYLDLAGSPAERQVARALKHMREMVTRYRLLGAYPMGKGKFYGGK
jgi:prephenate dehydratase